MAKSSAFAKMNLKNPMTKSDPRIKNDPTMAEVISEYAKEVNEYHKLVKLEAKTKEQVLQARWRVQTARGAIRNREEEILADLER